MNAIVFRRRPAFVLLGLAPVLLSGTAAGQTSGATTALTPPPSAAAEAGRNLTRNLNAAPPAAVVPPATVVPVTPAPRPQPGTSRAFPWECP